MSNQRNIIVIGGGAAGMIAAIAAAKEGCAVSLYEKNEKLGKKIFITGKGRCNVTNAGDMDELFAAVITNKKFMFSSFYGFTNEDMMQFLEDAGLRLKTERGKRVFPLSDHSSDVIAALERTLKKENVKVYLRKEVKGLNFITEEDKTICKGIFLEENGKKTAVDADCVIVATGGMSYPSTGSTGDGYQWAQAAGLKVTALSPALVPFETAELETVKSLQGLSLKNVEATVSNGKKELYRDFGEMLFTHFGVSGPLMLSASSFCAKAIAKNPLKLSIDLKPALTEEQLDERILRDFAEAKNKQFKNSLNHLYPAKLVPVIIERSGIDPDKQVNEITKEERRRLVETTKALTFTLTGLRPFKEAIITQGGVDVKGINPSTMEAKKTENLYFAGEVLDVDAVTGGFNLQIAWSTGWAAGKAAAEKLKENTQMNHFNIAVDGPAGAGKSTIAKLVAKELGFVYVDTGAMYRAMALYFLRKGVDPKAAEEIERSCPEVDVTIRYQDGVQQVLLNGEDVSGLIRTEEVGNMASAVSGYMPVREKLVELQKQLAAKENVIMDGRDIGTCVLPDAPAKIYLTASVEVRAARRYKELLEKGMKADLKEIEKDIEDRDYRDMHREHSPLKQAEDAVLLDTSSMTLAQVVEEILKIVREKGYKADGGQA